MPALVYATGCALGLLALGDLRTHAWQAMGVLLLWGFIGAALHRLDLARARRGQGRFDVRALSALSVFLAALAVRAPLLAHGPGLSDDLFRYMWEGWFTLHGGNPYAVAPAAVTGLDHPVRALVNHPEVSTIYPPVVMWGFALLARVGMTTDSFRPAVFQGAMALADAGIAAGLAAVLRGRGRSTAGAWLYAVLPLGAVESASSGHMEPLGVLCVVLAVRAWDRRDSGVGWAGLGALVKILPAVLLPRLWRRQPWLLALVLALGVAATWPFRDAGLGLLAGLGTYAEHWSFNASGFALLSAVLEPAGLSPVAIRRLAVVLAGLVCAAALWRFRDPARVALWAGAAFVLLSPTVHPWYLLWVWVPALICGVRSWTLLALLAPLSYAALASYNPVTSTWEEPWWPPVIQYGSLLLASSLEWFWHATRPGPWLPSPAPATTRSAATRSRAEDSAADG